MRPLDQVVQDCFRLADFDTPRDAPIASARLALRSYVATAQAITSFHVAEPADDEEDQHTRDFNLGSRYRDAAFEAVVLFQHFAELVVKAVLRADHELLVVIGERHHEMLHALLHGSPVAADDERRLQTIDASVALSRATTLLGAGHLDQSWLFIRDHHQSIERLNGLRNRLWHRGEIVLRPRALDELIGGYGLAFLFRVMQHPTYARHGDMWKHKALVCGLDPFPLIAAEVAQPVWSIKKVAFLKELARAAYENPLDEMPFFEADNARRRRRAEATAIQYPEHEVDRVGRCPVCGMNALLVYRASDFATDDEGNERPVDFTWLARCEGCSLDLRHDYGNASEHGLAGVEDYFGLI